MSTMSFGALIDFAKDLAALIEKFVMYLKKFENSC